MATIVILEHAVAKHGESNYMVHAFAQRWRGQGHTVLQHFGPERPPPGDLGILHVDLTVIPPEYVSLLSLYPRVVNGNVLDISKHGFSQILVGRDSDYAGPVVVKTDANFFGRPEWISRAVEEKTGIPASAPATTALRDYPIYDSVRDVPEALWCLPGLIVEKFMPERDAQGFYYMRAWTFFGDKERSSRFRAEVPIIKSDDVLGREQVEVPDEIRLWRERLGFDFGKFDYVVHDGRPILLDTNRTPGAPGNPTVLRQAGADYYAMGDGLSVFL